MKKISVKLFFCVVIVCLSICALGCSSIANYDGVELVPQGEPTPFEGIWEMVSGKKHPYIQGEIVKSQLVFHLNTWELLSNENEYGIMAIVSNGVFTYDDKTLSLRMLNIGNQGRFFTVEELTKAVSKTKKEQEARKNRPPYFIIYGYEINDERLLLNMPAYTVETGGRTTNVEALRTVWRKLIPEDVSAKASGTK